MSNPRIRSHDRLSQSPSALFAHTRQERPVPVTGVGTKVKKGDSITPELAYDFNFSINAIAAAGARTFPSWMK